MKNISLLYFLLLSAFSAYAVDRSTCNNLTNVSKLAEQYKISAPHLQELCATLQKDDKPTAQLISSSWEEAINCLRQCKDSLAVQELEILADSLEASFDILLADHDSDDTVQGATRGKHFNNIDVRNHITAGYVDVTGSQTIGGNLTIAGNETVGDNLIVKGNLILSGSVIGNGISSGSSNFATGITITGPASINATGAATTTIGDCSSTTNIAGTLNINTACSNTTTIGNTGNTGISLTVNGGTTSPAESIAGNGTTIAPALRLLNNPATASSDFVLTIDGTGNVKQSSVTFGSIGGGGSTNNYKAKAYYAGSNVTFGPGGSANTVKVAFNTIVFDPNGNFNTTTNTYTVPQTGIYLVNTSLITTSVGQPNVHYTLQTYVNGAASDGGQNYDSYSYQNTNQSASILNVEMTRLLSLTVGQTLQIFATSTVNAQYEQGSEVCISLLS